MHIYGPVPSRRLGFSLGVDLVPYKTCSFDCIYCQLGRTTEKTIDRKEYVQPDEILSQLKDVISSDQRIDHITLSGSGEPTLNSGTRDLIEGIKKITSVPLAVLTNGSLLYEEGVRRDLLTADIVLPSLDAVREDTFQVVNRPHQFLDIGKIVKGLQTFGKEYRGKLWLEVMLVRGVNDSLADIEELRKVISGIEPDRVQLNTVARPPSEESAHPLSVEELTEKGDLLGGKCEIIAEFGERNQTAYFEETETVIVELARRRPVTLNDICRSLGIHRNEAIKHLDILERSGMLKAHDFRGLRYYEHR